MVLLLALILRAGWAAAVGCHPISDPQAYQNMARELAGGHSYGFQGVPYTYWPIGYPFLLSLQMRVLGPDTRLLPIMEVLLGTVLVALVMVLCRQWSSQPRAAVAAGLVVAVYLPYVQFASITASETLFAVLLLSAFCCWGARRRVTYARAIAAGLFLGLATYVRPVALPLAFGLLAAHWLRWRQIRLVGLQVLVAVAVCLAVVAPWTYRNYRVYDRFILVSTNGGMCLFFGNNPDHPAECQRISYPAEFEGNDAERDAYCRARAMAYIKADPLGFVKRCVLKVGAMWDRDSIGVVWNAAGLEPMVGNRGMAVLKIVNQVFWAAFLGLVAVAVLSSWRSGGVSALLGNPSLWACLILTAIYAVTSSQDRYHHPCIALLAPLVGQYLASRRRNASASSEDTAPAPALAKQSTLVPH